MVLKILIGLWISLIPLTEQSTTLYDKVKKKADKEMAKYRQEDEFTLIRVSPPAWLSLELYKMESSSAKLTRYIIFDEAPSKVDSFIYMIIFDPDGIIEKVTVLLYRENYGGEIASSRFLSQFIGKSATENMKFNQDIDGISGATISAKSITLAIARKCTEFNNIKNDLK